MGTTDTLFDSDEDVDASTLEATTIDGHDGDDAAARIDHVSDDSDTDNGSASDSDDGEAEKEQDSMSLQTDTLETPPVDTPMLDNDPEDLD